jgi:large subunit ribosomal protein L19e
MKIQKRLAAHLLNASPKRVRFNIERLADINSAITKTDIRMLIADGAIYKINEKGVSRSRARHIAKQKSKDRQRGTGSRKGKKTSRLPSKQLWINKIRSQRNFIYELKEKGSITKETFRDLYMKSKGGYFRSTRHIKIYLSDNSLFTKAKKITPKEKTKKTEKKTGSEHNIKKSEASKTKPKSKTKQSEKEDKKEKAE